jgi:hypothetical protein
MIGIRVPLDGYSLFYELPCYFGAIFFGFLGVLLSYKICRRFFNSRDSFYSVVLLLFATPLIFYMEIEPSMSHAVGFFASTACIYAYLKSYKQRTLKSFALIGFLGGLTTLIRWQCASLIFFILLVDFIYIVRKSIAISKPALIMRNFRRWLICGVSSLLAFAPQVIAWANSLDNWWEVPHIPGFAWGNQSGQVFNAAPYIKPALLETLFHFHHGFFTWTPIAAPALVGFYFFSRKKPSPVTAILWLYFLSQVYFIAASMWTSGWSFGQRRLVETFIILALGIGEILHRLKRKKTFYYSSLAAGAFFIWFNLVFIYQWVFRYIPAGGYPNTLKEIYFDKLWVFPHMLQRMMVPIGGLFNIW